MKYFGFIDVFSTVVHDCFCLNAKPIFFIDFIPGYSPEDDSDPIIPEYPQSKSEYPESEYLES